MAPPAVYQCLANEMMPDVGKQSQFYGAVNRLKSRTNQDTVERFFAVVRQTSCNAAGYTLSLESLVSILNQHPFIGRQFDAKGMLVRDTNTNQLRLQAPDYSRQWAVEETSVDPAWIGQQVAFRAVVTGAGMVRAVGARKTLDEDQVYIQCLVTGFGDRKLYLSDVFLGSKAAMRKTEEAYATFLRNRYRGNFAQTIDTRCEYNVFAERAAELHAFTSKNNQSRLVLTGWKGS